MIKKEKLLVLLILSGLLMSMNIAVFACDPAPSKQADGVKGNEAGPAPEEPTGQTNVGTGGAKVKKVVPRRGQAHDP